MDELPIEHALGIRWSVEDDTLGFEMRSLVRPKTKCGILSTVFSLFDSVSFAAPVALSARCLVQDLWKANIGWDEPLSEEFLSGEPGTLSYPCCPSYSSLGPISCRTVIRNNASCVFRCLRD